MKKVVVISSSPRKGGNSDLLCDGSTVAGEIRAPGVYEKGAVRNAPAWGAAYDMGRKIK